MSYCPPAAGKSAPERACATDRLGWLQRLVMGIAGVLLIALLGTAAALRPNSAGMGTHRQLGLPPCTAVALFGVRCPACGMTTSWSHLLHGNVLSAVRSNTGGVLLALAAMFCGPWLLTSGMVGRWWLIQPSDRWTLGILTTIIAVTLVDWCVRLNA